MDTIVAEGKTVEVSDLESIPTATKVSLSEVLRDAQGVISQAHGEFVSGDSACAFGAAFEIADRQGHAG